MANPTLSDMRTRALDRADMTGSGFPVSARCNDYLNAELAALWDHLCNSTEDFATTKTTFSLVADQEAYSVPFRMHKIRKVYYKDSAGNRYKLKRFSMEDLDTPGVDAVEMGTHNRYLRYKLIADQIYFEPAPVQTGTIEVWYVPQYTPLTSDTDTVHSAFSWGWEDYAVEGAAARLLEREESDSMPVRAEQQRVLQRILQSLEDRDIGEPHKIIDVVYGKNQEDCW